MSKSVSFFAAVAQLVLAQIALAPLVRAQDGRQIMEEVQRRQQAKSQHYEGTLQVMGSDNRVTMKRWTVYRLGSFGNSKMMLRFNAPAEVKGVALLIMNHPDRASDQWMWRPAIDREQRIAMQDRSTRFFGTDFSFEDLEERDVGQYDFKLKDEAGGIWHIEAIPHKASQYTRSELWVKKENYTIQKMDLFNKKGLVRSIEYRDFEFVMNIWTARTTEVTDAVRGGRTTLTYDQLEYNMPLKDEEFTVGALKRGQ